MLRGGELKRLIYVCGGADFCKNMQGLLGSVADIEVVPISTFAEALIAQAIPAAWLFESAYLSMAKKTVFQKLCFKIQSEQTLGLIISRSIEEVFYWRQTPFKPLHLLYGTFTGAQIVERVHCLYEERLGSNLPLVVVFRDSSFESILLDKVLSERGLRVRIIQPSEMAILPELLLTDQVSVLVWNLSIEALEAASVHDMIVNNEDLSDLKIIHIRGTSFDNIKLSKETKVLTASDTSQVVHAVVEALSLPTQKRDRRCGILETEVFSAYLQGQIINRYLKFQFHGLDRVHEQWGPILVSTLVNEIFFYVKNHVRLSDVVARSKENDVLLCCLHSDVMILEKIAERVKNGFAEHVIKVSGVEDILSLSWELVASEFCHREVRTHRVVPLVS